MVSMNIVIRRSKFEYHCFCRYTDSFDQIYLIVSEAHCIINNYYKCYRYCSLFECWCNLFCEYTDFLSAFLWKFLISIFLLIITKVLYNKILLRNSQEKEVWKIKIKMKKKQKQKKFTSIYISFLTKFDFFFDCDYKLILPH